MLSEATVIGIQVEDIAHEIVRRGGLRAGLPDLVDDIGQTVQQAPLRRPLVRVAVDVRRQELRTLGEKISKRFCVNQRLQRCIQITRVAQVWQAGHALDPAALVAPSPVLPRRSVLPCCLRLPRVHAPHIATAVVGSLQHLSIRTARHRGVPRKRRTP